MFLHLGFPWIWYAAWPYSEKMNFDLLTPPQGWRDGVCRQNMFYYVAAFVIPLLLPCCCFVMPFNPLCSMTMFWKSWILTFWPHPLSPTRGSDTGLRSKITFDMCQIYWTSVCMWNFGKSFDNWLSYCEI